MTTVLKRMVHVVRDALFPTRCCECGTLFRTPKALDEADLSFRSLMAEYLCADCSRRFQPIQSPFCLDCGRPFASPQSVDHICGECQKKPFDFMAARAAGVYENALRAMIHQFKYRGWVKLADPLGRLLWKTFLQHWNPQEVDGVIPVPLHRRRLRQRGFNQAAQLIRSWPRWAADRGIDFDQTWLMSKALVRKKHTQPQTGLNQHQRKANLRQAFELNDADAVQGLRILLVDDVLTTGATANACSQILMGAGALSVQVLTLARAV